MATEEIYDDVQSTTYCDFQRSQDTGHGVYYKGLVDQGPHSVYARPLPNEVPESVNREYCNTHHKNYV